MGWGGQEIRILTEARGFLDRGHRVSLGCDGCRRCRNGDRRRLRGSNRHRSRRGRCRSDRRGCSGELRCFELATALVGQIDNGAADLDIPIRVLPVATVREADGLAMSSRNRFLSPADRATAPMLLRVMKQAATAVASGRDVPWLRDMNPRD